MQQQKERLIYMSIYFNYERFYKKLPWLLTDGLFAAYKTVLLFNKGLVSLVSGLA